jgi:uncharacterized phage protein (TIGR02220 family)
MSRGYIKLWRESDGNALYFSEPFDKFHAWIDLLLLANHTERNVCVRGILVTVRPGQVLAGEDFLATRWKWSRGKVRRFMSYLSSKTVQQIVQQKTNICTLITLVNWKLYQTDGTADDTDDSTTDGQQTVQQTDTPKNVENVENDKKKSIGGDFLSRFNVTTGRQFRVLDTKAAGQLKARISEGFTMEEIIQATRNCMSDPYHKENTKYLTPEFITRADKLQKFLNAEPKKQTSPQSQPTGWGGIPYVDPNDPHGLKLREVANV